MLTEGEREQQFSLHLIAEEHVALLKQRGDREVIPRLPCLYFQKISTSSPKMLCSPTSLLCSSPINCTKEVAAERGQHKWKYHWSHRNCCASEDVVQHI